MQPHIISAIAGFIAGVIAAAVPVLLSVRLRNQAFDRASSAYERIIVKADARADAAYEQLGSYMDRWYGAKNLPPSNVDMAYLHEERRQKEEVKREQRRNGGALPARIGAVDHVQNQMEAGVRSGKYARASETAQG
jgi:hypothetical protein